MKEEAWQYDIKVSKHNEAGNMYTFRCPDCGNEVTVADAGWWSTKCSCGYQWTIYVKAHGVRSNNG